MENTEKVLFEDDRPQWYIAMGENWVGPLTASDVYARVSSRAISWAHYIWKPGQAEWKRLCEVKTFASAVPEQPSKALQREVKEISKPMRKTAAAKTVKVSEPSASPASSASASASDEKGWFLYYNETQFGPFAKDEIGRLLKVGKITPRVHAWRGGLGNWTRLESLPAFKSVLAEFKPTPAVKAAAEKAKAEQRQTPRRPMVARILLANDREVSDAVCRDISVGGMQVLTDRIPGAVGESIRFNVSAATIEPFVAEGVIVRVLEDRKGFSFRFDGLSEQAKKSIEQYIRSAA